MQIIIVDDDRLVALSLKTILEADPSITVADTGEDGVDAIAYTDEIHEWSAGGGGNPEAG